MAGLGDCIVRNIKTDALGRMDVDDLERSVLQDKEVMTTANIDCKQFPGFCLTRLQMFCYPINQTEVEKVDSNLYLYPVILDIRFCFPFT